MAKRGPKPGRSPMSSDTSQYVTYYKRELVKCGKPNCKCSAGELHGPYWYAYDWDPGRHRLTKSYIGKNAPADLDPNHQVIATVPVNGESVTLEGAYPSINNAD